VNTADDEDLPYGEPLIVIVYVPGGMTDVVEIIRVEVAPAVKGVTVMGEKVTV